MRGEGRGLRDSPHTKDYELERRGWHQLLQKEQFRICMRRMFCIRIIVPDNGKFGGTNGLGELLEFCCKLPDLGEYKF